MTNKSLALIAAAGLLTAGGATAVPFGDGGAALQGVFDGIALDGDNNVKTGTDYLSDSADSYWSLGGSGGSVTTLVIELADFANLNTFGLYDRADPSKKVQVFAGSDAAGESKTVSILADGSVVVGGTDSFVDFASNAFGYYMDSSASIGGGVMHSDTLLNADGGDHMAAYQGVGETIQILPFIAGPWASNEYILAFEDVDFTMGSDRDFTDFVVLVESVSPLPDGGATLLLLGLGMTAIAGARKRFARA